MGLQAYKSSLLSTIVKVLNGTLNPRFKTAVLELWDDFDEILEELNSVYEVYPVLIGGVALQYYGVVRMTEDIDLLVSLEDYKKLDDKGLITYGHLRNDKKIQIDIVYEGMDGNPHPDEIRETNRDKVPTLAGLIYTKLIQNRLKDSADVVELIKANYYDRLQDEILRQLPKDVHEKFLGLMEQAKKEK